MPKFKHMLNILYNWDPFTSLSRRSSVGDGVSSFRSSGMDIHKTKYVKNK